MRQELASAACLSRQALRPHTLVAYAATIRRLTSAPGGSGAASGGRQTPEKGGEKHEL